MNPRLLDWQDRRVWLVGASAGIGAALATHLAARGARLALSARSEIGLRALGLDQALLLPCDVTDAESVIAASHRLRDAWGGVDLVIYLAGDYRPMTVADYDATLAERLFAVNFLGATSVTAAIRDQLVPGSGIAFVASVAGYRGLPRALAYGPGKAALIHFAECLHLELAPRGVGVWVVNPGFVATRLTERNDFAMPALITPAAAAEALVDGLGSGRFEIHFPKRFTRLMKFISLLPYRWYFPLVRRFTGT